MDAYANQQITYSFCHICEQNCGLKVTSAQNRILSIEPDRENPWSWRDFCIKAARQVDVVHDPARITVPMKRVGDRFVAATYEEALEDISTRLRVILDRDGPEALGCYSGNPGAMSFGARIFLTAMLDAIGTKNRFSVGSIDQNAWHVAMKEMYGNGLITLIPDIDEADCFMFIGANPAISKMCWLGKVPDGWRRVLTRVKNGAELIVVDPRLTETAQKATLHVAARTDHDWAFLLALTRIILEQGQTRDHAGIRTANLDQLRDLAFSCSLAQLAQICDVPEAVIAETARRLTAAARPVIISRTGPAMGRNGALTAWLAEVLNLLLARLDVPGGRYMPAWPVNFAVAGELFYPPVENRSRVRGIPAVCGGRSVAEIPGEILTPGEGQIRAFILHGGNLVNSGPQGSALQTAFAELELFVAMDLFLRDSHRHAHWVIPGVHFLERGETHVTIASLADRPFIQTGRAAVPPPASTRPEWEFFLELSRRMSYPIFTDDEAPTPDLVSARMLQATGLVTLEQVHAAPHGLEYGARTFGHLTAFLKARGRSVDLAPAGFATLLRTRLAEGAEADSAFPLAMITRRRNNTMNSWFSHTIGILGNDIRAGEVEINTADAIAMGVVNGQAVRVFSRAGTLDVHAIVSDAVRSGTVVMEHGWGDHIYDPVSGAPVAGIGVNRNQLVANDDLAPMTAVPRLNGTRVRIEPSMETVS